MSNKNFMSSDSVFSWLDQFINLERGQKVKNFRLDRMEFLCSLVGDPQKCAPSIHIAGSKGKGSVTAMITAILTEAGYRCARYMSPHVTDIRERLCIGDSFFDEEVYIAAGAELRELVEERLPAAKNVLFDNANEEGAPPTYFELLTLYFFLCAREANCNMMVVETGMGGRLDCTNVLDPLVSVITVIELEHTAFLGSTITEIAQEKAGIIKHGKPLVLAKQCNEASHQVGAFEVFKRVTQEKNSPLYYLPDITTINEIDIRPEGTHFSLSLLPERCAAACLTTALVRSTAKQVVGKQVVMAPLRENKFSIPIPGENQAENAALAIAAIKIAAINIAAINIAAIGAAPINISEDTIRSGLAKLKLPGRFEKISQKPHIIIDGAHTPYSLELCVKTFSSLYGNRGILIFGCAADKDAATMAKIAHSHFAKIIITTPGTFKSSDPAKVYEVFAREASLQVAQIAPLSLDAQVPKVELILDTEEAIKRAILFANTAPSITTGQILGTGSFYLVSEIRKNIRHSNSKFD